MTIKDIVKNNWKEWTLSGLWVAGINGVLWFFITYGSRLYFGTIDAPRKLTYLMYALGDISLGYIVIISLLVIMLTLSYAKNRTSEMELYSTLSGDADKVRKYIHFSCNSGSYHVFNCSIWQNNNSK